MDLLKYLTVILLAIWAVSEAGISLLNIINQVRGVAERRDRFSYFLIWLAIGPPMCFAVLAWQRVILADGVGSFGLLTPPLGYLGCLLVAGGITIRLLAVITLNKQFTTSVTIVDRHQIIDTGVYGIVRHPAYLGMLCTMLGLGLALGNWLGLAALVALPLVATLYRIQVEEALLGRHFGPAYQAYASRTKRLLPGIY